MFQLPKTNVEGKAKKKNAPAVSFTESELDTLLSHNAIDQEIHQMRSKGLVLTDVTADVPDAVRWQTNKGEELNKLKLEDARSEKPWIQDLLEDFVTFGLSPANTKDEAKIILDNLDEQLRTQEDSGFGPDARNYITSVRKELELLIENL